MRHVRPSRQPARLPAAWPRLLTMLGLLLVLGMLIRRTADPHTWTWLAPLESLARTVRIRTGEVAQSAL